MKLNRTFWIATAATAAVAAFTIAGYAQQAPAANAAPQEYQPLKVQGNVYLISGAGGNVAVQVGEQGVLVVDTGLEQNATKLVAAIKKLSDRPLQYIVNTHAHPDHVGGNDVVRRAGVTITGANVAGNLTDATAGGQILAPENTSNRMSAPTGKTPAFAFGFWPTITYVKGQKEVFFNEEPVQVIFQPAAHTDGDSIVFFRRSDVIATGDIFTTTTFPFIDLERGGSIQGELDALNRILDMAIPKHEEEGGTYIIPGHGRVCDEFDLLEYRDMVTIVRDRIQASIKKGMTLEQVKAAGLTRDYDPRWSAKQGIGTAANFVESIYKSLTAKK
jgi:glyoxylase-like metal-dependent hydrolase (beta-lactamase superfamily II)